VKRGDRRMCAPAACVVVRAGADVHTLGPARGRLRRGPCARARVADDFAALLAGDLDELLASPELDAVVVCSPTAQQPPACGSGRRGRLPRVLREADRHDRGRRRAMITACRDAASSFTVAFVCRFLPHVRSIKKAMDSGSLGDLVGLRPATAAGPRFPRTTRRGSRSPASPAAVRFSTTRCIATRRQPEAVAIRPPHDVDRLCAGRRGHRSPGADEPEENRSPRDYSRRQLGSSPRTAPCRAPARARTSSTSAPHSRVPSRRPPRRLATVSGNQVGQVHRVVEKRTAAGLAGLRDPRRVVRGAGAGRGCRPSADQVTQGAESMAFLMERTCAGNGRRRRREAGRLRPGRR